MNPVYHVNCHACGGIAHCESLEEARESALAHLRYFDDSGEIAAGHCPGGLVRIVRTVPGLLSMGGSDDVVTWVR